MADRIAVVTGASGGIGAACVERLRTSGFRIIGVDIREESLADEHAVIDASDPQCGERLAAFVSDRPVGALVNNAAIAVYTSILDTTRAAWDATLDTNLRAAFLFAQALFIPLKAARGSIVNVASVHAEATSEGMAAYAAAKGGLVALTRAMALEWAKHEIRVNCVLPGGVDTPMLREGVFRSESTVDSLGERHPLGRIGQPGEIADTIAYLLSEKASFVTGSEFVVDGGALARLSTE
jgi:NAD(P)-dependent dehydrogenase (short-subunit alcohol dehydrogenase family)